MKLFSNLSIKFKLILIVVSVTLIVSGLGMLMGMIQYERHLREDLVHNLDISAKLMGDYSIPLLSINDPSGTERVLNRLEAIPHIIQGQVYSSDHILFAAYKKGEWIEPPFPIQGVRHKFENGTIHLVQPIRYENRFYGHIYVAATLDSLEQKMRQARLFLLAVLLILLVVSSLLALLLQRLISRPILKLIEVTELISSRADLSLRVSSEGSDELGVLYESFNTMLEQLHQRDVERSRSEEEVKASLREKEVMLKEIHHRVKNNLQIISSLLSLQSNHVRDEEALAMFLDCQNRVRSMALVHEKLYQAPDLASIRFSDYVEALIMGLQTSYFSRCQGVHFDVDIIDIHLPIDRAVPCGLLIHELVSNSLKHAFHEQDQGLVQIKLRRDDHNGKLCLSVRDNGRGIPDTIDFRNADSLGLRLAVVLAEKQLKGTIELNNSVGADFYITF